MLSWIFRHRQRLAAIYGMVQAPALPGVRFSTERQPKAPLSVVDRPGNLVRRGRHLELRPMPPRVR